MGEHIFVGDVGPGAPPTSGSTRYAKTRGGIFISGGEPNKLMNVSNQYSRSPSTTPLVPVQLEAQAPVIRCKLGFLNLSGPTKDRIARYILEKALREGRLRQGMTVIEASSGSTSIAMALACAQLGLRFIAVMPEGVSSERVLIIRAYGGEIRLIPKSLEVHGSILETEWQSCE